MTNKKFDVQIELLNHLEKQGDSEGMRLAHNAFDSFAYSEGELKEDIRNAYRELDNLMFKTRARGVVGDGVSAIWTGNDLVLKHR